MIQICNFQKSHAYNCNTVPTMSYFKIVILLQGLKKALKCSTSSMRKQGPEDRTPSSSASLKAPVSVRQSTCSRNIHFELLTVSVGWSCKNINYYYIAAWRISLQLASMTHGFRRILLTVVRHDSAWLDSCPISLTTPIRHELRATLAFFLFLQYHSSPLHSFAVSPDWKTFPDHVWAPLYPLDFSFHVTSSVSPLPDHSI